MLSLPPESESWSRFHLDPNVPDAVAAKLWREILSRFGSGPEEAVFVADGRHGPAAALFVRRGPEAAEVFFLAALPEHRGRGLAGQLLARALSAWPSVPWRTEVYAQNLQALGFYTRYGFTRHREAVAVFHRW